MNLDININITFDNNLSLNEEHIKLAIEKKLRQALDGDNIIVNGFNIKDEINLDLLDVYWRNPQKELPDFDEYALWVHESGFIFMKCIDKDWDEEYMNYFIGGYGNKETSGRLVGWMPGIIPPNFK